jgi:hypothetical protein
MKSDSTNKVWSVEVLLVEDDEKTDAEAVLEVGGERHAGWGRARRNPTDPEVPRIGEELAAARALSDLAHKLLDAAASAIEQYEGHPVDVRP